MKTKQTMYYWEQIGMNLLMIKIMTVLCNVKDRMLGNRIETRTFTQIMSDALTPEQFKYLIKELGKNRNA
jgi:hypothetical protein